LQRMLKRQYKSYKAMRSAHSIPLLAIESLHNVLGGYTPNRAKYQEDMQHFSQSLRKYTV